MEGRQTLPYPPGADEDADLAIDEADDAAAIPGSVVVDPDFDWDGDRLLGHRWSTTVIYETHVKGFTMRHPDVPAELRGTYAGLASQPAIDYLTGLGVTAVSSSLSVTNSAWCQDSEISWFDWSAVDEPLREFARQVIELRQSEPVLQRRDFLQGHEGESSGLPDVVWFGCGGETMADDDWERDDAHALGVFLNGEEIPSHDRDGEAIHGGSFLVLFNAHDEPLPPSLCRTGSVTRGRLFWAPTPKPSIRRPARSVTRWTSTRTRC